MHGLLVDLDKHQTMMVMMMMMIKGTWGHPHLVAGLCERRGLAQVMTADAAPLRPVVSDRLGGSDVLVIQYVAVVIQDATAC